MFIPLGTYEYQQSLIHLKHRRLSLWRSLFIQLTTQQVIFHSCMKKSPEGTRTTQKLSSATWNKWGEAKQAAKALLALNAATCLIIKLNNSYNLKKGVI